MAATTRDVDALIGLAHRLREDTYGCGTWDKVGVHRVFHDHLTGMHLATAIEIVVRHASDPNAKSPGAIKRPFLPEVPKPRTRDQLPPRERPHCSKHPDNPPPPHCPTCATEPFKAYHDTDDNQPAFAGLTGPAAARAALKESK